MILERCVFSNEISQRVYFQAIMTQQQWAVLWLKRTVNFEMETFERLNQKVNYNYLEGFLQDKY